MQLLSIILSWLFVAVYVSASCPSDDSVSSCECEEVDGSLIDLICYGRSITLDQLKNALKALDRNDAVTLMLDEMKLGSIPSNFFQGFNIRKLEISHCELDSLTSDGGKPLTGLEDTLQELDIMTSFGENNGITKLSLGYLKKLEEVDISYNAITELENDWFSDGPDSLTHLSFSNNMIEKVGDNVFANLNNLNSLQFDGNRFGALKRTMLPNSAPKLEELELDNNALTGLPEDFFTNMPALKTLALRSNGLTQIPEKTFKPIWNQINSIDLRGNPIICDSHLDWIGKMESRTVFGRCAAPADLRGVELNDFLSSRS